MATQIVGTRSTSGDGTAVIAAPGAGLRNVITYYRLQLEADGDQTILLKSGSTTIGRFFGSSKGHGIIERLDQENELIDRIFCGANEAVYINLSAASAVNYTIRYYVDGA